MQNTKTEESISLIGQKAYSRATNPASKEQLFPSMQIP